MSPLGVRNRESGGMMQFHRWLFVAVSLTVTTPLRAQFEVLDVWGKLGKFGSNSTSHQYPWVDCTGLPIVTASGLPNGGVHKYKFAGICSHLWVTSTTTTSDYYAIEYQKSNSQSRQVVGKGTVEASAQFEDGLGRYTELFKVTSDDGTATMTAQFTCNGDPVLSKTVKCTRTALKSDPDLYPGWFVAATALKRPLLRGKLTVAQALAAGSDSVGTAEPPTSKATLSQSERTAGAIVGAMANLLRVSQPASGELVKGQLQVEVRGGAGVAAAVTVNGMIVRMAQLEWEAAPERRTSGRLSLPAAWTAQSIAVPIGWIGTSGSDVLARATVDKALLAAFPRWRVRATIPGTSVAPSAWVEFRRAP
jgi:hypothetical protein